MRRTILRMAALCLSCGGLAVAAFSCSAARSETYPAPRTVELREFSIDGIIGGTPSPIADFALTLTPEDRRTILAVIEQVHRECEGEIVVVTVPSLDGRVALQAAAEIGRAWNVGDLGVVLLLKPGAQPGDGSADIAVATGARTASFIPDTRAEAIWRVAARYAVETGSYSAGLSRGVQALAEAYADEFGFPFRPRPLK